MADVRILVVDDQEAKRYLKAQLLRRSGFECVEAGTGTEALALARSSPFDVVVLDVNLPDISGLEICRILKKEQANPPIQILQISETAVADSDRVRGLNSGADVYLTEPIAGEVLVATLRSLVRIRRVEMDLAAARDRESAARKDAERANRLKDDFLATLSHELRTPLNVMTGSIWRLRQTALGPDQTSALDALDRSTKAQTKLINDLLDLARITSGKLDLTIAPVDLKTVVEGALDHLRTAAGGRGLHIDTDVSSTPVVGDASRLDQIVTNLFNNAVQFTPPGGTISVTLAAHDGQAELRVRDTGEGIEPDVLPDVFNRFRQGDRLRGHGHRGLGLGLAIVQDLVRLHRGTVRLESQGKGQGTTAIVLLPLSTSAPRAETPRQPVPLGGVRVLVVEDDEDAARITTEMLERSGARATLAMSVDEAMRLLDRETFDVIVSDIAMPAASGYDLIRLVRERGWRMPALAVTAFSMPDDRRRALASGFSAHLPKPVDLVSLTRAVAELTVQPTGEPGANRP